MFKCWMKGHKNKYYAQAIYDNGKMTILAGSKISDTISKKAKILPIVLHEREKKGLFDDTYVLLENIQFNSATTAAQFVRGNIINGKRCWRLEESNITL